MLGTAGHIDHGKTALVRALTGVDTDRLPEEKARGITLVLGFAPLDLADEAGALRLSVVDVPGHEALVRTMVSGATGIDLVLLVVAADEGVMPQTREHAAICELLGLEHGVVALTRCDLVGDEELELASDEVRSLLAGTALADAPIVAVSALTRAGLPELRSALLAVARAATPRTPRTGPTRLAVDRVFTRPGFGSVVTGTLIGGAFEVGDAVEILPSGRRARVRGLESHGRSVTCAEPGLRCAANLQGVEHSELARGDVVTRPDALRPTGVLDVSLRWLATAPVLLRDTSVELLAGTLERRARVSPIGAVRIEPGASGFARIRVEGERVPLVPGDRFVLRGFARLEFGATLGGGIVLDPAPQRRRLGDPLLREHLEAFAGRDPEARLERRIARSGWAGILFDSLRLESGLEADSLDPLLAALAEAGTARVTEARRWLSGAALAEIESRIEASLAAQHATNPLLPGISRGALRGRLPSNVAPDAFDLALRRLAAEGSIGFEGDLVRSSGHRVRESAAEAPMLAGLRDTLRASGLEPPSLRDLAVKLDASVETLRPLLAHLERERSVIRAPGDLYFDRAAVDALRARVVAALEEKGSLDTGAYKALIGTSRRTAVPLMELFDAERITLRAGEHRLLRRGR